MRSLDWKLIGSKGKRERYNLASDPAEAKDLAAQESKTVAELTALYDKWLDEMAPPLNRSPSAGVLQRQPRPLSGPIGAANS